MKTWAGGGAGFMARPPGHDTQNLGRRRQQGLSNTLYKQKKKKVKNKLEVLSRDSYKL
jgi:hypothetical protein